jgi:capsid protein
MTALASKQRRSQRNYQQREQWFTEQAKARLAASRPPGRAPRSGIAANLDSMTAIAEEHQRYMANVKQIADSQQRYIANAKQIADSLPWPRAVPIFVWPSAN